VDNARDEFIELHNITGTTVNVGGWVLKDAVSFTFPAGTTLVPGSYVLLVTFSPSDTAALEAFRTAYGISASVPIHGPYTSKLSNSSGKIELAYPAAPVNGEIPLVLVDRVAYTDTAPWPAAPDGNGPSLQRLSRTAFGNDPVNWSSAIATPGRINPNQPPITDGDSDGDGMPDAWETANGFDPNSGTDSVQDSDGDGKSNAQEYLAGTNPRDSKSVFTSEVSRIAGGYSIRFTAMPNKSYTVQRRDSLVGGAWQKVADVLAEPAQRVVEVTDSANAEQRFYRVVTPLQP
jgi:hypothetical protein